MKWLQRHHPMEEEKGEEHPHLTQGPDLPNMVRMWKEEEHR
jgi:hypothetical protein